MVIVFQICMIRIFKFESGVNAQIFIKQSANTRHCHGSGNPVTRAGRVLAGTGTGRHSATRQKPLPQSRVSQVSGLETGTGPTGLGCKREVVLASASARTRVGTI